jgi:membrane-bound lytic murein transglycosylase A
MKLSSRSIISRLALTGAMALFLVQFTGCKKDEAVLEPTTTVEEPDYSRPLAPGAKALRKITDPKDLPSLKAAYDGKDDNLFKALDRSISWYQKPSSKKFYPMDDINHPQAQASVVAIKQLLQTSKSAEEFQTRFYQLFDTYMSVGWNGKGGVLFTGYYSPVFTASAVQTDIYKYPLYKRPASLVSDPVTGQITGWKQGDMVTKAPSRKELESSGQLKGSELVWLADPLDVFIIQVNGSTRLNMTDGKERYVGFAGTNGYDYTSVGKLLVADKKIPASKLSLATLRAYFKAHPGELDTYVNKNDRFVFFQDYQPDQWPAGALGVQVTDYRSLATDKEIFPRGSAVLSVTQVPTGGETGTRPFTQFMLDQDAGGAIRAPGRSDIYMGIGPEAEKIAGRQVYDGKLYYFFLKPEYVSTYSASATSTPATPATTVTAKPAPAPAAAPAAKPAPAAR